MSDAEQTTWDGLPVAREPPLAASVVVWRRGDDGLEFLILHRAHEGPQYAGEWAWGPPAGARLPDEPVDDCAARELREEAGLALPARRTECGSDEIVVYEAELEGDTEIPLSAEHDAYRWATLEEARDLCLPSLVADQVACVHELVATRT